MLDDVEVGSSFYWSKYHGDLSQEELKFIFSCLVDKLVDVEVAHFIEANLRLAFRNMKIFLR